MKLPIPYLRVAAALSLASGLMIGCQDFLSPDKTAAGNATAVDETGSLSLSIKNDSTCLGEWHAILDARAAGRPDTASEAAFLAACVTEAKPGKDGPKPAVPPALLPDSGMRCKWIVSQIEGGRDSLTVSYRKYCPDDCRKLEASDSASHAKLCHEPEPHGFPPPHPEDSLPPIRHDGDSLPPKPHDGDSLPPKPHMDDTCALLHAKLEAVKPGEPGRAEIEHAFALRCKEPIPHDTATLPPPKPPEDDTCALLHARLEVVKPGEPGRADLEHAFALRCKEPIPHDTATVPPPKPPVPPDTGALPPPKPAGHDSVCADLKLRLGASVPGTPGRSELEAAYKAECMPALPPPPPPSTINCDTLRLKLAMLDPASADYIRLAGQIKEHCPAVPTK
jgi:hypothetical protein